MKQTYIIMLFMLFIGSSAFAEERLDLMSLGQLTERLNANEILIKKYMIMTTECDKRHDISSDCKISLLKLRLLLEDSNTIHSIKNKVYTEQARIKSQQNGISLSDCYSKHGDVVGDKCIITSCPAGSVLRMGKCYKCAEGSYLTYNEKCRYSGNAMQPQALR